MYFYLEVNVCCSIFLRLARLLFIFFFFSSRRRHTRYWRDWSSDVCSSDLGHQAEGGLGQPQVGVLGEHAQVAGEGELRAGADGVALHRGDRHDPRRAQPAEPGLVAAEALLGLPGGQPPALTETTRCSAGGACPPLVPARRAT